MNENLSPDRLEFLRDLATQHPGNVSLTGETVLALLNRIKYLEGQTRRNYQDWQITYGRAEAAEAAAQRVREVMSDWETDEDAKGLHFDLERALDGGE